MSTSLQIAANSQPQRSRGLGLALTTLLIAALALPLTAQANQNGQAGPERQADAQSQGQAKKTKPKAAPRPRTPRIESVGGTSKRQELQDAKLKARPNKPGVQGAEGKTTQNPQAAAKANAAKAQKQKAGDGKKPVAIPKAPRVQDPGAAQAQEPKAATNPQRRRVTAAARVARKRAVRRALEWLQQAQRADGSIGEEAKYRVATTGLAVLSFFASGSTQHEGRYAPVITKAIDWLREQQAGPEDVKQKNFVGLIGTQSSHSFHYGHAIGTWALIEARQRGNDKTLDETIKKALHYIERARNPYRVWRYYPCDGDNDSSVTAWMASTLRRASAIGVAPKGTKNALRFVDNWYEQMTDPNNGRCGYTKRGERPARNIKAAEAWPSDASESLTALGLAIRLEGGATLSKKPVLAKSIACLNESPPTWNKAKGTTDLYYWYWGARAYAKAPKRLKAWRDQLVDTLLPQQSDDGSWPTASVWGSDGGPVYATSLAAMSLLYATHKSRL